MTCIPNHLIARPVLFRCPESVRTDYNAPENWFTTLNDNYWLRVFVQPQDWTMVREGQRTQLRRTFTRKAVQIGTIDYTFTLQMNSDDFRYRYIFEELAELCYQSNYTRFTPITILDYVRPSKDDYKDAIANDENPHTRRTGLIEIEDSSGANGVGTDLYGVDGFRVVFRQVATGLV